VRTTRYRYQPEHVRNAQKVRASTTGSPLAGWALWKALITLVEAQANEAGPDCASIRFRWRLSARRVIDEVLAEHGRRMP